MKLLKFGESDIQSAAKCFQQSQQWLQNESDVQIIQRWCTIPANAAGGKANFCTRLHVCPGGQLHSTLPEVPPNDQTRHVKSLTRTCGAVRKLF